jgi:hypothetical protein
MSQESPSTGGAADISPARKGWECDPNIAKRRRRDRFRLSRRYAPPTSKNVRHSWRTFSISRLKKKLIRRFGAEHPLEARANKLHAHHFLAVGQRFADMHDFSLSLKILSVATRHASLHRDADFQI